MRDKADATEFTRTIDRSHRDNIRVILPPKVDEILKSPDKVTFTIVGARHKKVEITAA